jgi:hypothetical protein
MAMRVVSGFEWQIIDLLPKRPFYHILLKLNCTKVMKWPIFMAVLQTYIPLGGKKNHPM